MPSEQRFVCSKCDKDFTQQVNAAVIVQPESHGWPINTGEIDKETGAVRWKMVMCGNATPQQVSDYKASVLAVKSRNLSSEEDASKGFNPGGFTKIEGGKQD